MHNFLSILQLSGSLQTLNEYNHNFNIIRVSFRGFQITSRSMHKRHGWNYFVLCNLQIFYAFEIDVSTGFTTLQMNCFLETILFTWEYVSLKRTFSLPLQQKNLCIIVNVFHSPSTTKVEPYPYIFKCLLTALQMLSICESWISRMCIMNNHGFPRPLLRAVSLYLVSWSYCFRYLICMCRYSIMHNCYYKNAS